MTRTGLNSSTDDYSAVGKVGITHELTSGSIVYAADVQTIYANGETVRKWFAGWNFMGTFARRYLVVEVNGSGSCHVEQDSDFSMDPFMPVLNRFVAGSQYVGENKGAERWAYDHDFSINCSHIANASTDEGGSPFLSSGLKLSGMDSPLLLFQPSTAQLASPQTRPYSGRTANTLIATATKSPTSPLQAKAASASPICWLSNMVACNLSPRCCGKPHLAV